MRRAVVLCATAVLCVLFPAAGIAQQPWRPVTAQERTLSRPLIDANADAEILLWDVAISDTNIAPGGTDQDHYLRIKIYNERGRDAAARVDLRVQNRHVIRDVAGRSTAPDGTIIELAAADVRERTIVAANGVKIRAQSFVIPAVVPGSVIEYRWRDTHEGAMAHNLILPFQRQFPVLLVRYLIRPTPIANYRMRTHVFNTTTAPEMTQPFPGFTQIQATNLPAAAAEPYSPQELSAGAWMFLYYASKDQELPEQQFWQKYSMEQAKARADALKLNGDLTKAATEAITGATTPAEKVQALVRYVRQRVRLVENRSARDNGSARDTLKRGTGTSTDIVVLFTALARAAGFDAHLARLPDREVFVAQPRLKLPYFLTHLTTAIHLGNAWAFVDAANRHAPAGQVRWQQEGAYALVFEREEPAFLAVGFTPREMSLVRRTASLRLQPSGDLEGEVAVAYTGHLASRYREQSEDDSVAERERRFSERVTAYLPRAAASDFRFENLDDPDKPLIVRFTLTAPGFAQRTGTRLSVPAAALPREVPTSFPAARRTRPIVFPFAWSEQDALTIELPEGYEVESSRTSAPLTFKDGVGNLEVKIAVSGRTLTYTRALAFGRDSVAFPVDDYTQLKTFFDGVRTADGGSVLLRRAGEDNAAPR
jgi:hypothetical protein